MLVLLNSLHMEWLPFRRGRRRTPFNNVGPKGLTCGAVTEQLYVGGELGPRDVKALHQAGITVIINLQHEQQDSFTKDEQLDGYLWLPSPDRQAPTVAQLRLGVALIRASVAAERRVFVHCKAGQGRAPLLCACYLLSLGHTPISAMQQVRQARMTTMLTPTQSARLREFAALVGVDVEEEVAPETAAAPAPAVEAPSLQPEHTLPQAAA